MHAFNARIVGGAVRNTLMHLPNIGEIDLATPFTPDEMIYIADILKLKHIPTGISHGTITILSRRYSQSYLTYIQDILQTINQDNSNTLSDIQQAIKNSCEFIIQNYTYMQNISEQVYEFTTLRDDVETDGRHAKIRYTKDWQTDADRRDFTINALYVDVNLCVHDLVNGIQDIHNHYIRFVGNPSLRIQEDYLRILRFFRFNAHYGENNYDQDALQACKDNINGLKQISQERLFAEFNKLLKGKNALLAIEKMQEVNIFTTLNWPQMNTDQLRIYQTNIDMIRDCIHSYNNQNAQIIPSHTTDATTKIIHKPNQEDEICSTIINADVTASRIKVSEQKARSYVFLSTLIKPTLISEALFATFHGNWNALKMPKKTLQTIQSLQNNNPTTLQEWYKAFYHHNLDWVYAKILITPNLSIEFIISVLQQFQTEFAFPLAGKDILTFCEAGPRVGVLYTTVLDWWLNGLCKANKDACLAYLKTIL